MNIHVLIKGFEETQSVDSSETYIQYCLQVSVTGLKIYNNVLLSPGQGSDGTKSWQIKRRYRQFNELHEKLKSKGLKNIMDFPFPTKRSLWQSKQVAATQRQSSLQAYVNLLTSLDPLPFEVVEFLEVHSKTKDLIQNSYDMDVPLVAESDITNKTKAKQLFSFLDPVINSMPGIGGAEAMKYTYMPFGIGSPEPGPNMDNDPDPVERISPRDMYIINASIKIVIVMSWFNIAYHLIKSLLDPIKLFWSVINAMLSFARNIKVGLEAIICVFLLLISIHRLLGWWATLSFRANVMNSDGSYNISVEWISFRIGLDQNEIVFHGMCFHNPPVFNRSPYFIRINQTRYVVDLFSMVDVLLFGNKNRSIHIYLMELDGIDFYIEKGEKKEHGINLWAALGAQNESQEKDVQEYVMHALASASNIANPFIAIVKRFGRPRRRSSNVDASFSNTTSSDPAAANPMQQFQQFFAQFQQGQNQSSSSAQTTIDSSTMVNDAVSNIGLFSESGDLDDYVRPGFWQDSDIDSDTEFVPNADSPPDSPKKSSAKVVADNKGWGVPYIFEVDRLTIHDFKLHAQDLFNAKPSNTNESSYIFSQMINMEKKELTKPAQKNSTNKSRRGLRFDELSWRLIYRTTVECFTTNQLTMFRITAAATVNQTTNAVLDVAKLTSQGISNAVYNYNPVQIFNATKKSLEKVVAHRVSDLISSDTIADTCGQGMIPRSPSVELLGVTALRVRLIKLRDLRMMDGKDPTAVKCLMRLEYFDESLKKLSGSNVDVPFTSETMKSSTVTKDRDDEYCFNEVWHLEPLLSLDAAFHLIVYEAGLFGENELCSELIIPLRDALRSGSNNLMSSDDSGSKSPATYQTAKLAAGVGAALGIAKESPGSFSRSQSSVQRIVSQFDRRKDSIGINVEVVLWHSLIGRDSPESKLGEVKMGLSLVKR